MVLGKPLIKLRAETYGVRTSLFILSLSLPIRIIITHTKFRYEEIIATEETYVKDMTAVWDIFADPMVTQEIISDKVKARIFSNLRGIVVVNSAMLREIKKKQKSQLLSRVIGDVFHEYAAKMSVYTEYCINYHEALKEIRSLKKSNEKFAVRFVCTKRQTNVCSTTTQVLEQGHNDESRTSRSESGEHVDQTCTTNMQVSTSTSRSLEKHGEDTQESSSDRDCTERSETHGNKGKR